MKVRTRKFISTMMAVVMLISMFPVSAFASEEDQGNTMPETQAEEIITTVEETEDEIIPEEVPAEEPEEYVDINDFIQAQDQQEAETRKTEAARRREETKKKIGEDGLQILAVIRKMAELKDQGIITEAEFEKKKRALLKRL